EQIINGFDAGVQAGWSDTHLLRHGTQGEGPQPAFVQQPHRCPRNLHDVHCAEASHRFAVFPVAHPTSLTKHASVSYPFYVRFSACWMSPPFRSRWRTLDYVPCTSWTQTRMQPAPRMKLCGAAATCPSPTTPPSPCNA